jgi:hypothetical protein
MAYFSEEEFLAKLAEYSISLSKSIINIRENYKTIEGLKRVSISKLAFAASLEKINQIAIDVLIRRAVEAAIETEEYNYDLYINHLITALNLNRNELITITPIKDAFKASIKINLNPLGGIEEWGAAVNNVREDKNLGKTKGAASKIWKEKIYRVDREGGKVYKYFKGRGKDSKTELKDITERYVGKYKETIEARLSRLDPKKAPFWHLINEGNVSIGLGKGEPYPSFSGTYFVHHTELELQRRFDQIYAQYYNILEVVYNSKRWSIEFTSKEEDVAEKIDGIASREIESSTFKTNEINEIEEKSKWVRSSMEQLTPILVKETYKIGENKTRELVRNILTGQFAKYIGIK